MIGAGFGGLGAAVALRAEAVDDVVVLERGDGVGGVWRDNSYPGAACDVPSHLYSFSFALEPRWTHAVRRRSRRSSTTCAASPTSFGLRAAPAAAHRGDRGPLGRRRGRWRLTRPRAAHLEADVLVSAVRAAQPTRRARTCRARDSAARCSTRPAGTTASACAGERVAVVGTGASAIQIVPAIADEVAHLTVFQRSAPTSSRSRTRRYTALHHALFGDVPAWPRRARAC